MNIEDISNVSDHVRAEIKMCIHRFKKLAADAIKKSVTLLDLCGSSLRRGHANLFCIVPIFYRMIPEGNPPGSKKGADPAPSRAAPVARMALDH